MILQKLESLHLDLHIRSYKIHKTASKLEYLHYPIAQRSLASGNHT